MAHDYVLEEAITTDFALVHATGVTGTATWCSTLGTQLQPARGDGRPRLIAEVEELVEPGAIDPDRSTCRASMSTAGRWSAGTSEKADRERTTRLPDPAGVQGV